MNLISCKRCGVVIDKDQLIFPSIYDHDSQELIRENAEWDGEDYVPFLPCPVCEEKILDEGKY